jgi:4-hydroxybenzoate polyprenyltransferase
MVLGVVLAYFCHPDLFRSRFAFVVIWAVAATCVLTSSNYVLNEILDAPTDRHHPLKRQRPIPSDQVNQSVAYAQWLLIGAVGLIMAANLNAPFFWTAVLLLMMGCIYNIPPIRSKNLPYLDVLTESANNPLRLLLGWFAVSSDDFPPVSLLIAYWMIGAFLMAGKRFAEFRSIGRKDIACGYRSSFRWYDEQNLLVSMFFYVICFAFFLGVFVIRYHLELILIIPLLAGGVCYYVHIAFKEKSAVQNPEQLYREIGLMSYLMVCLIVFISLMFVEIPALYQILNVAPAVAPTLWRF